MAESKIFVKKCVLLPSKGEESSLKEEQNITAGVTAVDYFESIERPSIFLSVRFIDVDQLIGRLGVTGGEFVDLTVIYGDEENEFKITEKDHQLILNGVKDITTEFNKQTATLEFISVENYIDETARVNKKYTGNISDTVFELLVGDKKGIQTKKTLFGPKKTDDGSEDRATNSYSFVGNLKHPFEVIQGLCAKAQSAIARSKNKV